jgi:hypothetical protein
MRFSGDEFVKQSPLPPNVASDQKWTKRSLRVRYACETAVGSGVKTVVNRLQGAIAGVDYHVYGYAVSIHARPGAKIADF